MESITGRRYRRQGHVARTASLLGVGALIASSFTAGSFGAAAFAESIEIVPNGTFESGIAGWTAPFGGTLAASADAKTGQGALEISERTGFQSGPAATVTGKLTTDASYNLSVSLKYAAAEGAPETQDFNAVLCTSSRSKCDVVSSVTAAAGEWATITETFTPLAAEYDVLFLETPWNTSVQSFVIDDFSLSAGGGGASAAEPPAVPGNLLPDGRFASDFTGWSSTRGGTLALSDDAASGAHSLQVSERENTQSGPFASVAGALEVGASYRMSGKLKYDSGNATQQFNFTFCPSNFNGCADYGHTFNQGEWGAFAQEFTAEAKHAAADWFFVETPWGSNALQDFKVDELSLVKIADAPPAPEFTTLEKVQTKPIGDHNPLVGHKFGADPHHLVYKDRLYIYSTDDTQQYEANSKDENGLPTQSNGYGAITRLNVMSTSDMVNWVDHGSIPISRADGALPWSSNSWAPAAIEKDGKVYLYFCDNGSGTAVTIGGSPLGPWTDPLGKKIIPDTVSADYIASGGFPAGMWLFDPEVFIDDDGQGYLYFGGNSQIGTEPNVQGPQNPKSTRVAKLKDDMVTLDGDPVEIDAPGMFEASSMFKRDGKYYYSYSSNFQVEAEPGKYPERGAIAYMMTDDPMDLSASKYAGVAFQNQGTFFGAGNGGNNHSDMFNYKGETYLTYHAQTRGAAWAEALGTPGATQGYRSVHIDKLEFNEDGTIKPVEGTRAGVEQVESFDPYRTFEAETLAWQLGLSMGKTEVESAEFPEHNGSGNLVLSSVDDGDFAGIAGVDFGTGAKSVSAKVKPLVEGASIQVRLDNVDGAVISEIPVTGAVGEWTTVTADVTGAEGEHDVFFVFAAPEGVDGETDLVEVDNWAFAAVDDSNNGGADGGNGGADGGNSGADGGNSGADGGNGGADGGNGGSAGGGVADSGGASSGADGVNGGVGSAVGAGSAGTGAHGDTVSGVQGTGDRLAATGADGAGGAAVAGGALVLLGVAAWLLRRRRVNRA